MRDILGVWIFGCLIGITNLATAQGPDTLWTKTYGGSYFEEAMSVQQTADSGYIITGYTHSYGAGNSDVYLVKTDSLGGTLWTRTFGGTDSDYGRSVQQTADGGYIIAGYIASFGGYNAYLIKTDDSGDTVWTKTYGGVCLAMSVQQTTDGGYIITGRIYSYGAGEYDVYLIKTDGSGDTMWTKTYGGTDDDYGYSVQQIQDGGYIIAGATCSYGPGDTDVYLIKADSSGDTVWTRSYGGSYGDYGYSIQQIKDGGFIVVGKTNSFGGNKVYLLHIDSNGDTLWTKTYGNWAHGYSVHQTFDGGYVVAGNECPPGESEPDVWLVRTDTLGNILWTRFYGNTLRSGGYSVQQTKDGGYIIGGYTRPSDANRRDFYLVKTNPVWLIEPNGGEHWAGGLAHSIVWKYEGTGEIDHYKLLYSTDGGYTYLDTITSDVTSTDTSYRWILPTINSITCRVKIQVLDSFDNLVLEDASDTNFTIDSSPPNTFNLISPSDSQAISVTKTTFIWEASNDSVSGLKHYEVYINDTLKHTSVDTNWTAYSLKEGWHNWYVLACDSAGNFQRSNETWRFLIDRTSPSTATLILPPDNTYLNDSTVNFGWHKATDNLSGIYHYVLQYALDSGFSQGLAETSLVDTTFIIALTDTIYYWRIKTVDNATNESDWSAVWNFTIDTQTPAVPALISPSDSATISDNTPTFIWSRVTKEALHNYKAGECMVTYSLKGKDKSSEVRYDLRVICSTNSTVYDSIADTTYTLDGSTPDSTYFWQIKAFDMAGNISEYSDSCVFFVDTKAPEICSTTVWVDTSFHGPFPVYSIITDDRRISKAKLWYKTNIDTNWTFVTMDTTGVANEYLAEIPAQPSTDTVLYYIYSEDIAVPPNEAKDPSNAPDSCYSFIARYIGTEEAHKIPKTFFVAQNCPNPFIGSTQIEYGLPKDANVKIIIYNLSGQKIAILVNENKKAGYYTVSWNGTDRAGKKAASGIYFYRFEADDYTATKKIYLIR